MALTDEFRNTPYYDDFSEDKNFHRLLFRPGRAVQARELTQSQTIIQDQITKFGNHLFKDGSRVTGASVFGIGEGKRRDLLINFGTFNETANAINSQSVGLDYRTIANKTSVNHINLQSISIDTGSSINVANFVGKYITSTVKGAVSNANGVATVGGSVRNVYFIHHADSKTDTDPDTIYVSFLRTDNINLASSNTTTNSALIAAGGSEDFANTVVDSNVSLTIHTTSNVSNNFILENVKSSEAKAFGQSKLVGVTDGVFYTNGLFVKNPQQVVAVDKYGTTANVSIGFEVNESIVQSDDDASLLDPALDSSNYLAPGSDRYKVSLDLTRKTLDANTLSAPVLTSTKYIELVRYKDGLLVKDDSGTKYSELERTLARRTFDESGDYTVRGLTPRVSNLGNSATAILTVEKGKAYVKGYECDKISDTNINLPKARDTAFSNNYSFDSELGNYIFVHNSNNSPFFTQGSERVRLYSSNSVHQDATTAARHATLIGEGFVKQVGQFNQPISDDADANAFTEIHKLHLFNVKQLGNTPIALTKSIVANSGANVNVHSTSISTLETTAVISNSTNNIIVSNPTGIRVGDEVFGENVSNLKGAATATGHATDRGVFVTSIIGSNVTLSNTVRSGIGQPAGTTDGVTRNYLFQRAEFRDAKKETSIIKGGYDFIKLSNNATYTTRRLFKDVSVTSGVLAAAAITTTGPRETFVGAGTAALRQKFYQINIKSGGTGAYPVNTQVDMANTGVSITTDGTASPPTLSLTLGDTAFSGTIDILTSINVEPAEEQRKTVRLFKRSVGFNLNLDGRAGDNSDADNPRPNVPLYTLNVAYLKNVENIFISTKNADQASDANTNYVDRFVIDTGQRDSFFDLATIKLKDTRVYPNGYSRAVIDGDIPGGNVRIDYNFYVVTGNNFIDERSYTASANNIPYEEIPDHITSQGEIRKLRDCLDFRPLRIPNGGANSLDRQSAINNYADPLGIGLASNVQRLPNNSAPWSEVASSGYNKIMAANVNVYDNNRPTMHFTTTDVPSTNKPDINLDQEYYLRRNDKVVLGFDKQIRVLEGKSALNDPPTPADDPDSMTLAKLSLDQYSIGASNVKLEVVKNTRYTMKDIGDIDDRLSRVEYYTSLNLLESEIAGSTFFSNNDVELLSNGFVVDPFRGHGIGDVTNPDYKCSIDYENGILKSRFNAVGAAAEHLSGDLQLTGGGLTLPFTEKVYTAQETATTSVNINPFNVVGFVGHVKLTTDTATYADFSSRPLTAVNADGNSDNYESGENFTGSKWNEWNFTTYRADEKKIFTYYDQDAKKIKTTSSAQEAAAYNTKTESDLVFYYANVQDIDFEIFGFKPNTEVHAFIDNKNVSDRLQSFRNNNYSNRLLVSDENGFCKGRIKLPNDESLHEQFIAGEHQIIFCDSILNPTFHTTIASTTYYSGKPQPTKSLFNGFPEDLPADVELNCDFYWDQVNQNPGCATINDKIADIRTRFQDRGASFYDAWAPIVYTAYQQLLKRKPDAPGFGYYLGHLAEGDFPDDATNQAHIDNLRQRFKNSPEFQNVQKGVLIDPLAQTFFVNEFTNPKGIFLSSVDVFFATKDVSLPVTLEIRKTVNGYPGSEILKGTRITKNPSDVNTPTSENALNATTFTFEKPVFLEPDEYSIVLLTNSSEYRAFIATVGESRVDTVGLGQTVSSQPYTGSLFKSQNASTWEPDQFSDLAFVLRQCEFDVSGNKTTKIIAKSPTSGLLPTSNIDFVKVSAPYETFSDKTNMSFVLSNKGASVPVNGIQTQQVVPDLNIYPDTDIYLPTRGSFSANGDTNLSITMSSTNSDVSPTFDIDRCKFILVENLINNFDSAEVTSGPETQPVNGGARTKYITKKITLAEDFDASALRVIIAKNLPEGTANTTGRSSVEVYYRVQNKSDEEVFETRPFVKMDPVTPVTYSQNNTDFYDCEYRAEDIKYSQDGLDGGEQFESFKFFQIKIVLFANMSDPSYAPSVKNLRAIALS